MNDEEPAILRSIGVEAIESLLQQLTVARHFHPAFPEGMNVVQFEHHGQCIQLTAGR